MLKQGWKPKRTIILCLWDGEEEGLLGSTEWAETHAEELKRNAAVYINSDGNSRGYLQVEGSHTLEKFMNGVAKDIDDPESKLTVWKRMQSREIANGGGGRGGAAAAGSAQDRNEARSRADLRIGALGSGSDYTAFLDFLGVASMNVGFGGEDQGGIYHSIYDDFYWYTHFADTNFVYGRALAQTAGTAVMRLADAELLPYDFDDFTDTVRRYDEGVFAAVVDPRTPMLAPPREAVPPFLNFAPLDNGLAALQRTTEQYDKALGSAMENGGAALARAALKEANDKLVAVERALTLNEGLPNRPWFKHQIYAPGFYTGYGVKTLPAVRESIEQKNWKLADDEIGKVGKVLENAGEAIQGATSALGTAAK